MRCGLFSGPGVQVQVQLRQGRYDGKETRATLQLRLLSE